MFQNKMMKWFHVIVLLLCTNAVVISSMPSSDNTSLQTNNTFRKPVGTKTGHESYSSEKKDLGNNSTSSKK